MSDDWTKRTDLLDVVRSGLLTTEVDVLGNKVEFSLLTAQEEIDVKKMSTGYDLFAKDIMDRREILARSVQKVNGKQFDGGLEESRMFFGKLNLDILDVFWNEFSKLKTIKKIEIQTLQERLKKSSGNQEAEPSGGRSS